MLYPVENGIREVKELSGIWQFKADYENTGREQAWYREKLTDTIAMPVPASYNDITTQAALRDHIGDVWYERMFHIPVSWKDRRIVIRVGSATHHAVLWINGEEVTSHKGGFLPFEADITDRVKIGAENRVTLAVNNILDWSCLPSGEIKTFEDAPEGRYPKGHRVQDTFFDFFNYAGLHRPVKLYATPLDYIEDITVTTDVEGTMGVAAYSLQVQGQAASIRVRLMDAAGNEVAAAAGADNRLTVNEPNLWEPGRGYLYTLEAELLDADGAVTDSYQLPVGIRTVEVKDNQFLINGKPFYFKGFGKHEDADIRGRGLDEALNVKDFNLMKWAGANSFRTSHYPYSEELLRLADREGFVVIDEVPAVGMCFWSETNTVFREDRVNADTLKHHLDTMGEMIRRDKNHPCVVMWSIANEAATNEEAAVPYFTAVAEETRRLDPTRPITIVQTMWPSADRVGGLVDIICLNKYFGWYSDHGQISVIERHMDLELQGWHEKYGKPIIITEYGADTIAGHHQLPAVSFSEEFQYEFLEQYHRSFDKHPFVIGEQVWAFADFATKQGLTRVVGNKKGIFTRQRQPKAAAYKLRERWTGEHAKW
ncbi:beta-D-glucuronidase [Paenibacillus mucilaginosus 3016]|uniref:Beta-glucuronidase n=1 Tax=Paenibacillus mucilaginosus 3016 TaxID=1116391 RepID=H6NCK0_9BACL|nr:beta-glucuronidase [Paenibacillus mucilaginosus]AFC28929.1 beta-D-glucuronidase [Paenibacillus mucilaginosus 3016]